MSKYTTGEIAKLCGVTVRTVQYYDTRGILVPSDLSEGGRRLYSENDLRKMKVICFLREIGLPLGSIGELFSEDHPEDVVSILLEQQEAALRDEISESRNKLQMLERLRQELKSVSEFSVESIGDVAHVMENKKKLRKIRAIVIGVGLICDAIEIGTILLWIFTGIWWPFVAGLPVWVGLAIWTTVYYLRNIAYICPKCHTVFKPSKREAFFANHTPTTRKLTCTHCGHKGFCVETYDEKAK